MSLGIYAYYSKEKEEIVYVGKDSQINKNARHRQHMLSSRYNKQPINRVLQNNPDKYEYKIIYECLPHLDDVDLNGLEMQFIEALNPKFNFTLGGDGSKGFKPTKETRRKMSEAHKGQVTWNKGKKMSDEFKNKISKTMTKPYARVVKHGFTRKGTQNYGIKYEGKLIQSSTDKSKLEKIALAINEEAC